MRISSSYLYYMYSNNHRIHMGKLRCAKSWSLIHGEEERVSDLGGLQPLTRSDQTETDSVFVSILQQIDD